MSFSFRPLQEAEAREIVTWRYQGPQAAWNLRPEGWLELLEDAGYHGVWLDEQLVGYACLGEAAAVTGGRYAPGALDFGLALHPARLGQGLAVPCALALFDFLKTAGATRVRATIPAWNTPALRACQRLGFRAAGGFGGFRRAAADAQVVLERDL